jgi:hypothetical protein
MSALTLIAQTVNYLATPVAVVVGGSWVYFKFLRGRTFAQRAEVGVEVIPQLVDDKTIIHATIRLNNAGISKLPLRDDGKVVLLYATPIADWRSRRNFQWEMLMLSDIFTDHSWLESQEVISDDVLLPLDHQDGGPWLACRVQVQIWSEPTKWRRRGSNWIANVIVPIEKSGMGDASTAILKRSERPLDSADRVARTERGV